MEGSAREKEITAGAQYPFYVEKIGFDLADAGSSTEVERGELAQECMDWVISSVLGIRCPRNKKWRGAV